MRTAALFTICLFTLSSCVTKKVYEDLESRYDQLRRDWNALSDENLGLKEANNRLENELMLTQKELASAESERDRITREYDLTKKNLELLQESYDALEANSSAAMAENLQKNRELLSQLEAKEAALSAERARLEEATEALRQRESRINELEALVAAKEAAMTRLKDAISKALLDFEGKGLTVVQKDGKVYVSMENKLLFESGSWQVGAEGRRAVTQLAKVLSDNPDINILIEGHTDSVPYNGNTQIVDNWDLSTKRATAIVRIILENGKIQPKNLTAAGRGEYVPVATNENEGGKARNRRIEIILTPNLDEITKLLNDL